MVRTQALFTNFCVAWLNLPSPPIQLRCMLRLKLIAKRVMYYLCTILSLIGGVWGYFFRFNQPSFIFKS